MTGGGEDHDAATGVLLREDAPASQSSARGSGRVRWTGEDNDSDGGQSESNHRKTQNRQLTASSEARGKTRVRTARRERKGASGGGQHRVERPGGGGDGENGKEASPGDQGSLAQDEARTGAG